MAKIKFYKTDDFPASGADGLYFLREDDEFSLMVRSDDELYTMREDDPTVPAHVKAITSNEISEWSAAFGNMHSHANKSVLDSITALNVSNWDSAYSMRHSHSNKDTLDATEQAFTTALKGKLDDIQANANNYVHPTGDGNLHVPVTGTGNLGKFLRAGATAGAIAWALLTAADIPVLDASKITTGVVTVARGGTGSGSLTGVVVGNGSSAMGAAAGTANQILRRNAANTAYEFWTPNFLTSSNLSGYATESWVTNRNYITAAALTDYVTRNTSQDISGAKNFTSDAVRMSPHYYHNLYGDSGTAYVHYYPQGFSGVSYAEMRVSKASGGFTRLSFSGNGIFNWNYNFNIDNNGYITSGPLAGIGDRLVLTNAAGSMWPANTIGNSFISDLHYTKILDAPWITSTAIPTNYVTINSSQWNIQGHKHWISDHRWYIDNVTTNFTTTENGFLFLKSPATSIGQPVADGWGVGIQFTTNNDPGYRHQLVVTVDDRWYVGRNGASWKQLVTKEALDSYVTTNTSQNNLSGNKDWLSDHYWVGSSKISFANSAHYIHNSGNDIAGLTAFNNVSIRSWNGVSIGATIDSPTAPVWSVDARSGDMYVRGISYLGHSSGNTNVRVGYNKTLESDTYIELNTKAGSNSSDFTIARFAGANGAAWVVQGGSGETQFRNNGGGPFGFTFNGADQYRIFSSGRHRFGGGADQGVYKVQIDSGSSNGSGLWVNGIIYSTNNVKGYSDRNLKSNIERLKNPVLAIQQLTGYSFEIFGRKDYGLIAQDVKQVLPHAVSIHEGRLVMSYEPIHALTVEAIKELIHRDDDKEVRIKELERKVVELEGRLAKYG